MQKKIFVFPGTGQFVKNYGYDGMDIWLGKSNKNVSDVDYAIGHSLGASFALKNNISCDKIILINPLIKRRGFFNNFYRWLRFLFLEGISRQKLVPFRYWPYNLYKAIGLLKFDVLDSIKNMPKEKIIIIRGNKDEYFCDGECCEIIKESGFKLIEVDCGHDWNENCAEAIKKILEQ